MNPVFFCHISHNAKIVFSPEDIKSRRTRKDNEEANSHEYDASTDITRKGHILCRRGKEIGPKRQYIDYQINTPPRSKKTSSCFSQHWEAGFH